MELTGKLIGASQPLGAKNIHITFEVNEPFIATKLANELKEENLDITVIKHRKKRSLDANAYCWVLIDKLAERLSKSATEIYQDFVREIGGNNVTVCCINEAVDELRAGWKAKGKGWVSDVFPSKVEGCTNVILYYGSSTYDVAQMQRLINLVQQECEQHDIQTKTPQQIAEMLSLWSTGEKHNSDK